MKKVQIYFEPIEHKYTDDEGNVYTSATQLIDKYKPKFHKEFWAFYRAVDQEYGMLSKPRPDIPNRIWCKTYPSDVGRYYTLPELAAGIINLRKHPDLITQEWLEVAHAACERGNKEHDYLENCVNGIYNEKTVDHTLAVNELPSFALAIKDIKALENSPLAKTHKPVFELFKKLLHRGFTLFAEKRIYSYEHQISGMIDILAVNANNEFYIVDWKTNKDPLKFKSGYYIKEWNRNRTEKIKTDQWVDKDERMFAPIDDLQNCKGTLYSLQLSLYARLCELWGLKCLGLVLCHLRIEVKDKKEIHHDPIFYDIPYLKSHIDKILSQHEKKKVKKKLIRKSIKY
jgi:hypothetical protein